MEKVMQQRKSRRTARILLVILVVFGLWPATACSSWFDPPCKEVAWKRGPVVVVADVALVRRGGSQAREGDVIPAGTTLYPQIETVCKNGGDTLYVQHKGKSGWIARSQVAPQPPGTPSPTPTPRPTRSTC
jgi:hypothetical protein